MNTNPFINMLRFSTLGFLPMGVIIIVDYFTGSHIFKGDGEYRTTVLEMGVFFLLISLSVMYFTRPKKNA